MSIRREEGVALFILGLVSLAVTRWPNQRLARLFLSSGSRPPPSNARTVRIVRYVVFTGVVLFGAWLATGH